MIDAFFWPKAMRQRHYKILVRPTLFGEYLIFPHGYKHGGVGYIMSTSIKKRVEAPLWGVIDSIMAVIMLLTLVLSWQVGWGMLGLLLVEFIAWHQYMHYAWKKHVVRYTQRARPAPVKLTKARYRLEYASQLRKGDCIWNLLGFVLLVLLPIMYLIWRLSSKTIALHDGGAFLLALVGAMGISHTITRLRDIRRAFQFSVKAGDPVYFPLPEPEADENGDDLADS